MEKRNRRYEGKKGEALVAERVYAHTWPGARIASRWCIGRWRFLTFGLIAWWWLGGHVSLTFIAAKNSHNVNDRPRLSGTCWKNGDAEGRARKCILLLNLPEISPVSIIWLEKNNRNVNCLSCFALWNERRDEEWLKNEENVIEKCDLNLLNRWL